MKNERKLSKFIIKCITSIILIFLISIVAILLIIYIKTNKNTAEIADFAGFKPTICVSNSMETEFEVGDIVISKKCLESEINIGDIITYQKDGSIITHRIKDIVYDENGKKEYITKGDSNNIEDEYTVDYNSVEGKYCYKIPKIGIVILALKKPQGFIAVFFIPIALIAISYKILLSRKELKELRKRKLLKRLQEKKILQDKKTL